MYSTMENSLLSVSNTSNASAPKTLYASLLYARCLGVSNISLQLIIKHIETQNNVYEC